MKRSVIAIVVGCLLTIVPIAVIRSISNGNITSLTFAAANLALPGTLMGLILSGRRIDDVNQWIVGFSNFVFYSGLAYLILTASIRIRSNIKNTHH
jgi:hypothetical protein